MRSRGQRRGDLRDPVARRIEDDDLEAAPAAVGGLSGEPGEQLRARSARAGRRTHLVRALDRGDTLRGDGARATDSVSERNSAPPGDAGAANSASAASGARSADISSRGSSCSSTARSGKGAARVFVFAGATARRGYGLLRGLRAAALDARIGARTRVRAAAGVARADCFALRLLLDPIVSPSACGNRVLPMADRER